MKLLMTAFHPARKQLDNVLGLCTYKTSVEPGKEPPRGHYLHIAHVRAGVRNQNPSVICNLTGELVAMVLTLTRELVS